MTQEVINTGSSPDSGDGDTLRGALTKANLNFTELYGKVGDFPDALGLQGQVLLIDISGNVTWGSAESSGSNASTLNNQGPSYYLDYTNFTNTPTVTTTLAGLTDTSVATATSGQVLTYDGAVWTAQASSSAVALNDLSNVSVASPSNGQALVWNGSAWVAGTVSTSTTIGQLTDVDTSSAVTGSVLKYNGTSWAIGTDAGAGAGIALTDLSVTTAAAGSASLAYNNATGQFTYTPPDLSSYLTSVPAQTFASLTSKPTTLAGYGITDGGGDVTGTSTTTFTNKSDFFWKMFYLINI